ncbi:MAG: carboxypeptidase regulatory-like domain-containing protein [Planctomycetia bacterium]|nr:carboxypeptidase regulatory-like domain-containing protein [Planctomycetia bacterium]
MKRTASLCGLFLLLLVTGGCGNGFVSVNGKVTLDGTPVAGAQVTFVTESGDKAFSGATNDAGDFEISSGPHKGVPPGNYKVTVIKAPAFGTSSGETKAGDPEYMKDMMSASKKDQQPKTGMKNMAPGGKGMMMMPMGPGGGASASPLKSELPSIYSLNTTTPFKVTVPHDGPVVLDLKDDKKAAAPKK